MERYPVLSDDADVDSEEEKAAYTELCAEMKTSKPRRDVFLSLMRTFRMRRHYILHSAVSVQHIVRDYPALKEPASVRSPSSPLSHH